MSRDFLPVLGGIAEGLEKEDFQIKISGEARRLVIVSSFC
jgi:hypothetical protein